MAVRGDIWVDWDVSPRVIWIQSPSVELTIQDLVDTCRELEADPINMAYDFLISAAGKDTLAVGVVVGITATLQNAVVAFENRPGPAFVRCVVRDGNLLAIDALGDPLEPIKVTDYTQVKVILSASATIVGGSPTDIADAVWDEPLADHTVPGSTADKLKKDLTTGTFIALK